MATWAADGTISGAARKTLVEAVVGGAETDAAVYDAEGNAGVFTVPGSTDAQIVTRMQYGIPYGTIPSGWSVSDSLTVGASFTFVTFDFSSHSGQNMSCALYVVSADKFDEGVIPTPAEIIMLADAPEIYPAEGPGISSPASNVGFSVFVPVEDLEPNTKYWALLIPCGVTGDPVTTVNPLIPYNANGRALSFWTNRTPLAPVITSPISGTVVTAGRDVTFSFKPNDPDGNSGAPGDYRPWSFADMSGIQVQYRPRPTLIDPDPGWSDLPIASTIKGDPPVEEPGWFIEYANSTDRYLGAKALHHNRTMQIRCGGTSLIPGHGVLPSGDWQLRMRTFDYGHALSTLQAPFGVAVPGYGPTGTKGLDSPEFVGDGTFPDTISEPDLMPETNTSPWSTVVNISVSTEVPAPVPISPINHVAIAEDLPVVLRWQYRNTHVPPFPQEARQVQIRPRGDTDWTTLVSGNSAEHFYSVTDMVPDNGPDVEPPEPPYEYMEVIAGGTAIPLGFEDGTVGDWETNSPGVVEASNRALDEDEEDPFPGPHSGDYSLAMTSAPSSAVVEHPFRRRIFLREEDKFFSVKGWASKGPDTTQQQLLIWILNEAETEILYTSDFVPFDDGPGWKYQEVLDIPLPIGGVKMWVQVLATAPSNQNVWDAIDDFSVLGSPTLPVEPEAIPPLDLPVQAPVEYPLLATTQYEWRVRVADAGHVTSEWSTLGQFWVVPPPDSGPAIDVDGTIDGATLGCGTHRVEIYRRGGKVRIGELTQVSYVDWGRLRDDISDAKIIVSGWDIDCGNLLASLQTWAYEVVIFRDNGYSVDRVWEGPITLLTYENTEVTIHAKDVAQYLYRRIIKQEMNDGGDVGGATVVARASRIIQNVLAPDDPNVLAYLQPIVNDTDPMQYRNLPAWSRTAYEEIDDMAANSGLDYTAVGRAILLWGTKSRIGTLPELRDENLGSSPVVSEYGMQMANVYSVSDGNGVHGEAYRLPIIDDGGTGSDELPPFGPEGEDTTYGLVEMLSSSWASDAEDEEGVYTQEGLATIQESFAEFAERSISDRYPPPVVVRVPDNTTLNPNTVLSIQNLVPGVVIPLRSGGTLRVVKANQKLDSIKVVETADKETISITLSPFNYDDAEIAPEG